MSYRRILQSNKMKYISDGTWFDKDTECELLSDFGNGTGLFFGIRTCQNSAAEGGKPLGTKYRDEEVCGSDEFKIVDETEKRTFFGEPLRDISLEYHSCKLNMEEFATQMKEGIDGFVHNLNTLPVGKQKFYIERWLESFTAWFEVEQDLDV